ncbi:MAG: tetratricopeptide repeat protein [Candidatus Sericytochromatia bacterium]
MNSYYSLMDAWQAFETGQYELAATIWKALIEIAPDAETRRSHASGYSQVLIAQGKWDEARALLQQLLAETGEAQYFHQLGQLERRAGRPEIALEQFQAEAKLLEAADPYSLAANRCESAYAALEMGDRHLALAQAEAALTAARTSSDPGVEAGTHRLLGEIAAAEGNLQRARECYADAAVSYAMAGDPAAEQEMADRIAKI